MKQWLLSLLLLLCAATTAQAQFKSETKYVGASLTGLGISYNGSERFKFGLQAEAGYFIADYWMVRANVTFDHAKAYDNIALGVGGRYYFQQNGIFLGAGAEYAHFSPNYNDLRIPVEVGYTFYLNHYLAIEPALYYKMSLNDFSDHSTVGLRIGLGYYF